MPGQRKTSFSVGQVATGILLLLLVALGSDATHWQNRVAVVEHAGRPTLAQPDLRADRTRHDEQAPDKSKLTDWALLLVIFAQTVIYFCQSRIMKASLGALIEQGKLGRDEFNASHRPLLAIHSLRVLPQIEGPPLDDQPLRVQFAVVNAGTGRCVVAGSAVYLQYLFEADKPYLPELARNDAIDPRPYEVGATDNSVIVETDRHGWLNHDAVSFAVHASAVFERENPGLFLGATPQGKTLYLSGWVVYRETSGNSRTTYFRRRYQHTRERFATSDDPDDEKTY